MFASGPTSTTLSGISTTLGQVLGADAQEVTAMICGCSQSAVSRRADDLHQWPVDDLIKLAMRRPPLAEAIIRALRVGRIQGDAAVAVQAVLVEGKAGHLVDDVLMGSLADGRVDASEAGKIRDAIAARRKHEDEVLLPALAEVIHLTGGRPL
jgi:hypothetical protein